MIPPEPFGKSCDDRFRGMRIAILLTFLLLLPLAPGCGGCNNSSAPTPTAQEKEKQRLEEEAKKKEKEKPKPDFDKLKLNVLPHDGQDLTLGVKPGHWVSGLLDAKANNFDFTGELTSSIVTSAGAPIGLEHTAYLLNSARPVNLPKGQDRRLETLFFFPRSLSPSIESRIAQRGSGTEVLQDRQPVTHMAAYQYYFYVLASQPDRYRFLKVLDTIKPPWNELISKGRGEYYRVQLPRVGQNVALPSHPLAWTSTAVVLWDDIHPKVLRSEQQQAMLDWLHWGGQLLVSGPRTLDLLRGSFLDPYLPADAGETLKLDQDALDELSDHWSVVTVKNVDQPLLVKSPWTGIKLKKRDGAAFIPHTNDMLAENRVGRGRVVVSAFRLLERDLVNWRSYDSFLNNALLRRPRRVYSEDLDGEPKVDWAGLSGRRFDPALITNLRYFSRDGGSEQEHFKSQEKAGQPADIALSLSEDPTYNTPQQLFEADKQTYEDEKRFAFSAHQPGVAGWSDFNPVSDRARLALKDAAGIVVPDRDFVVWVVGLYLLVIVPLNWLVFYGLGRVEWAWVAAPVIAIAFGMTVVKLARLDIGFARSTTEVAIVEMYGGYPRAHVTRYTALYTSLSTGYDVHFEDPSAVAAPFSTDPGFQLLTGQSLRPVNFRRDNEVHLSGYQISSNSTGMLHSEHYLQFGGAMELLQPDALVPRLANNTTLTIEGTAILRKVKGELEYAWIGTIRPKEEKALNFRAANGAKDLQTQRNAASISTQQPEVGTISLKTLFALAEETQDLQEGDVRLVGWTEEEIPGVRIEPSSSQQRHAALVLVHLRHGLGPAPQKDVNTRAAVVPLPVDDESEYQLEAPLNPPTTP